MITYSWQLVAVLLAVLLVLLVSGVIAKRRPSKLNQEQFGAKWHELQSLCADKKTWPLAVINADKLVDDALKKQRYKGKTMGERLVSAQHDLSSNDTIWFGHKLRNKLVHEDYKLNSKSDVKSALLGFLQALRDLGAIKK
ncbi:MAG: hypothetical protein JWN82_39 [Candidatus Saccharibacteria bacterium]|nr:hypothetical protein [Candidatus Saccharibacteria bacterium]